MKVPGITYSNGDLVNVLFIKGTEPIAFQQGAGSPSSPSASGNVWPLAGQNMLEGVNSTTVTLLIAAMSTGDIGYLGARSSNEAVTANETGITLRGVGASAVVFTTTFTVTLPTTLQDIQVEHSGVADTIGFDISDSATLIDCIGIADSTGTSAVGLNVTGSAQVIVRGGYYEGQNGTAVDIAADASATVFLDGPTLFSGTFGGTGTILGWYQDTSGGSHFVYRTGGVTKDISFSNGNLAFGTGSTLDLVNTIDEISIDGTLAGNSDLAVPTEKAVKTYVDANASNPAAAIHAAASKTTPVDADELALVDSAASWVLKKLTWANLKATLLTWMGTLINATKVTKLYNTAGLAVQVDASGSTVLIEPAVVVHQTMSLEHTTAKLTLLNITNSNADGGRVSSIVLAGRKADSSEDDLVKLISEHDGAGNDYKGRFIIQVDDGSGAVVEQLRVSTAGLATPSQITSSLATGTAPLSIASTTVVPNLNADMVDGVHANSLLSSYVITVSVATNDLTVALKTLAGTDPSATDPIRVKIGDVWQTITAALSVTALDGTNWFNSGATGLATKDIDYFVYLIQETGASAGTKIGFSRIPYAETMADFSATTTAYNYIKGNYTNSNATDPVVVIGRFNAILSATAAFTWSLTTLVVINRPIYETRWLSHTPTVTSGTGTITTLGAVSTTYMVRGRVFLCTHDIVITTNGTAAQSISVTFPFSPAAVTHMIAAHEFAVVGKMLRGLTSTNLVTYAAYDNTYPGGTGAHIVMGVAVLRLI